MSCSGQPMHFCSGVDRMEVTRANDPRIEQLRNVLIAWGDVIGIGYQYRTTMQDVIALVDERLTNANGFKSPNPVHPELHAAVQVVASWNRKPADEKSLGNWARRNKNRYIDGLRLCVEINAKGKSKWWVENKNGEQKAAMVKAATVKKAEEPEETISHKVTVTKVAPKNNGKSGRSRF